MTRSTPASAWRPALFVLVVVAGCGDAAGVTETTSVRSAIYGGTAVAEGDWESVVALQGCTGVLVTDRLVLYAAHCGTYFSEMLIGSNAATPRLRLPIDECRAHPDAALGNGLDVAYCLLAQPTTDLPAVQPIEDDEQALVRIGTPVTEIGFGLDTDQGLFGIKRQTVAQVQALGDDLVIAGTSGGTCEGDSGGPALVRLDDLDPALPPEWRLLGLLSAGTSFHCGVSTDHYSNIRAVRSWIESQSGIALSGDGTKAPTLDGEPGDAPAGCQISRRPTPEALDIVVLLIVALAGVRRPPAGRVGGRRSVCNGRRCSNLAPSTVMRLCCAAWAKRTNRWPPSSAS
jgi:hypothetical protein